MTVRRGLISNGHPVRQAARESGGVSLTGASKYNFHGGVSLRFFTEARIPHPGLARSMLGT